MYLFAQMSEPSAQATPLWSIGIIVVGLLAFLAVVVGVLVTVAVLALRRKAKVCPHCGKEI